jgi:hypothetical protein
MNYFIHFIHFIIDYYLIVVIIKMAIQNQNQYPYLHHPFLLHLIIYIIRKLIHFVISFIITNYFIGY